MTAVIGIDFGSAYSRGAFWNAQGLPEPIRDRDHPDATALLPSAIYQLEDGSTAIGWLARRKRIHASGEGLPLKRQWLGDAELLGPVETSTTVLFKEIKKKTEEILKTPVEKTVLAVPGCFPEASGKLFQKAAEAAGFKVLQRIPETAAAALAYGYLKKKNGVLAVYSFGAGFFEFVIARIEKNEARILAMDSTPLGGLDMDCQIGQYVLGDMAKTCGEAVRTDPMLFHQILEESEKARCALSHRGSYDFHIEDAAKGIKFRRAFSRFELAKWVKALVEKTVLICEQVIKKAGVQHQDIAEVLLAGGVTRMPFVHETVEKIFRKKPGAELNPDLAVVYGALIQASILDGGIKEMHLEF